MKRLFLVLLMLCCLPLCACSDQGELGLYVLPAAQVGEHLSAGQLGSLAEKQGRLALHGSDFVGVDWEHQVFAVRPEAAPSLSTLTAESGGCSLLKTTDKDVFVWVKNGKALYYGGFPKGVSNPNAPYDPILKDQDRYRFAIVSAATEDKRFNKVLYQWFYAQGLIKGNLD